METKPTSMLARPHSATQRSYEDFDPASKWRIEENRDIIEIHIPGFRREQLKIQVNHHGFLAINAERHLEGNRWKRFSKEIEIPRNCDIDAIYANFAENILSVVMPKKNIPPVSEKHQQDQIPEPEDDDDQENQNLREQTENLKYKGIEGREGLEREDHYQAAKYRFQEDRRDQLTSEATSDVAFKFLVVVILILIIANYVADMFKSVMAHLS